MFGLFLLKKKKKKRKSHETKALQVDAWDCV